MGKKLMDRTEYSRFGLESYRMKSKCDFLTTRLKDENKKEFTNVTYNLRFLNLKWIMGFFRHINLL